MKRAIVTGAAFGIGRGITQALLADGWGVIAIDRNAPSYYHEMLRWLPCNVGSLEQVRAAFATILNEHVDALIQAAGERDRATLLAPDAAMWRDVVQINLVGVYYVLTMALPLLRRSDDARVLLFSGGGAFGPAPTLGHSAYAASKAGVVSLMESAADELRVHGVTVNCIAPGPVPTKLTQGEVPEDNGEAMERVVEFFRFMLGPQTHRLTGKAISIPHDGWRGLCPENIERVNASDIWTRTRVKGDVRALSGVFA